MRIKRTDKNFTVRRKAGRKIHYAGQGKKYTVNTFNFSPKEKQDALRQKNFSGAGTGVQTQVQRQSDADRNVSDLFTDDTAESYQQEYGNVSGIRGRSGNHTALGNLHVKRPLQEYPKESVSHGEQPAGNGQAGQQPRRPSAYHENIIKTKEPVLHRKAASGIEKADSFSLKERKGKTQKAKLPGIGKTRSKKDSRPAKTAGGFSTGATGRTLPASGYAQSFADKRQEQLSGYKKEKFFGAGERKYRKQKTDGENAGRKAGADKNTVGKTQETYTQEIQLPQMQNTAGGPALSKTQGNLSADDTNTSHIKKRNAGDSIRKRDGDIHGRKDKAGGKDKKGKKDKGKDKDAKKDNRRSNRKSRKDRAAALRLLSYASDKFSQEEQRDSLLKAAGDILAGKVKAAAANALLSIGAALLPALIPAFIIVLIITLLFNSPFSILLPKLSEEPGAVEVLLEYTEDFRERVQEELADPERGDETELIYEDYEGDGEPDNMADILMVYMVSHGFGDTATVMTEKNKRALKNAFDEMTSLDITYRAEVREQSYEEEDFYGNIIIKTEEVEVKIKEVRITLLTSEDMVRTGIFTEEETEILRYLMSPEVLENIEGLTGGYGSPGRTSLTTEEAERLSLGGDTGSQAVKNALARLGKPYSQAERDSGDYYDCSSLTVYDTLELPKKSVRIP